MQMNELAGLRLHDEMFRVAHFPRTSDQRIDLNCCTRLRATGLKDRVLAPPSDAIKRDPIA